MKQGIAAVLSLGRTIKTSARKVRSVRALLRGPGATILPAFLLSILFAGAASFADSADGTAKDGYRGDLEQTLGASFQLSIDQLPRPNLTQSVRNFPLVTPREAGDRLLVPEGFTARLWAADGLVHPREMALAPNGDVFLSEPNAGRITRLRDSNGDGTADKVSVFAEGLSRPYGLAFIRGHLLVADTQALWRFDYDGKQARAGERMPVTIPGAFGSAQGHWTRSLAVTSDEVFAYVGIGSSANLTEDRDPRASIQKIRLKDGKRRTFASGLRNPVGLALHPQTEDLYGVVNERDRFGDRSVPDFLAKIVVDEFYGFPYAYAGPHPDPEFGIRRPDLVAATRAPEVLFEAHSAPIDVVFYEGDQFPRSYQGDAFVTLRGSWNAARPRGYKVVRVPFDHGQPTGTYENFAVGFWRKGAGRAEVFGRPTGLLVLGDGSLLVADDAGKAIWRISYTQR